MPFKIAPSTASFPPLDYPSHRSATGPAPEGDNTAPTVSLERLALPVASDAIAKMERESILRAAIEICPFGIVIVEPLGKIVLANGEMERMFGYAHDELIGRPVDVLVPTNMRAQHAHHRRQFAAHPGIRMAKSRKLSARRQDGTEFPVEVGLSPIHTNEGVLVLGVIVDISERLRIEGLKDEFIATVSHELRTPLTSIAGALGLLVANAGGTLPGPMVRLLTIARANSLRLVRLVNNILDMEKIESGKVAFVLKRVAVSPLVEQSIEDNRGFADEYGVRIRLDAASVTAEMCVDPDWLLQIVTNLVSNAVKFSPRGEEVVVAIERRGASIRISVRDHGHGIPDEFRSRIFEKFAQADNSDARQQGGTGLGLSIVKQIVNRLGGEVGFGDAPGGGAVFHVDLPSPENGGDNQRASSEGQPDDLPHPEARP